MIDDQVAAVDGVLAGFDDDAIVDGSHRAAVSHAQIDPRVEPPPSQDGVGAHPKARGDLRRFIHRPAKPISRPQRQGTGSERQRLLKPRRELPGELRESRLGPKWLRPLRGELRGPHPCKKRERRRLFGAKVFRQVRRELS